MSMAEILDSILLKPLQLIFEVIYAVTYRVIDNPGGSIVVLSLVMNFLVLPLYKRADAVQEEQRRMEMRLQKGVAHIRKTFRGDEQMMLLRTYYRQNDYRPAYVLRGAAPLFLEIPFFIAAYRFLSGLQMLNGTAFGPIADLGQPDGLLVIGGVSIHILPVIMTAVNLASCMIFTKDHPLKMKLQLYGMAAFFLFFLYSSPSGLVFYWTLNNIFSFIKTIFYKLRNPRKVLNLLLSAAGAGIWIYGFIVYESLTWKLRLFFAVLGMTMQFPAIYVFLAKHIGFQIKLAAKDAHKIAFFSGGLFLAVLTGLLIPSAVIKSSPQEFISGTHFYHPDWFLVSSFGMSFGLFVIWGGVFYWLASSSVKPYFDRAVWIFSGTAVINYMFFNKNFGSMTSRLVYEQELGYRLVDQLWNFMILMAASFVFYVIYEHFEKRISEILIMGILAFSMMSIANITYINSSIENAENQMEADTEMPGFTLSRSGKNVIVLMLDRAMGEQIPYIFDEKPKLKEQFGGFTYYSNVISFGRKTNFGSPALLGGYEYTPAQLNKRDGELLVSKHNEALKVMPVLFDQNGYEVTVINPVYANYQWIPDLTVYDGYPDIKACYTGDKFLHSQSAELMIENNKRNFFCYGLLKSMPLCTQKTVYNKGRYNQVSGKEDVYSEQSVDGSVTAEGISAKFMEQYSVLQSLPSISSIDDEDADTFLLMVNDITHEPMLLQEPEYEPSLKVDNTAYEDADPKRVLDENVLKLDSGNQMTHYHANMAAMIQLGKWFDFMRKEGVYDNTRIIIVSDHGEKSNSLDELILDDGTCVSAFFPLLMIKDFESREFSVSDVFMTNADVPTAAVNGIIENPINPFTGKRICTDEKTAHDQYIIDSYDWQTDVNNGCVFMPADWLAIHDNIWDKNNWKLAAEDTVLSAGDD